MKFSVFVFLLALTTLMACDKDKFQTKPTISIKSVSTDFVPLNGSLVINIECTDKEGDVQDSVIIIKRRLNRRAAVTVRDTLRYPFPVFPPNTRTEIQATLNYISLQSAIAPPFIPGSNPARREPDTLILRLAVRDKAGNTSDTVETHPIYIFRQ